MISRRIRRDLRSLPECLRRALAAGLTTLALMLPAQHAASQLFDGPPPYVVTPQRVAERMLALAKVGPSDHVIDLGSGDGRIVITAAKRYGASGLGVEIRGDLVTLSQRTAAREGIADRARFALQDALQTDLSKATVLTLYLSPELNAQLLPRIMETMRPGARIVGHDFGIGTWTPDHSERMHVPEKNHGRGGESTIMLWLVPANASGRWHATIGGDGARLSFEFSIAQQFQQIEIALHGDAGAMRLAFAELAADRITLELPAAVAGTPAARRVSARIEGDRMTGTVSSSDAGSGAAAFSAQRIRARPDLH